MGATELHGSRPGAGIVTQGTLGYAAGDIARCESTTSPEGSFDHETEDSLESGSDRMTLEHFECTGNGFDRGQPTIARFVAQTVLRCWTELRQRHAGNADQAWNAMHYFRSLAPIPIWYDERDRSCRASVLRDRSRVCARKQQEGLRFRIEHEAVVGLPQVSSHPEFAVGQAFCCKLSGVGWLASFEPVNYQNQTGA